jgi:hypothetical protein
MRSPELASIAGVSIMGVPLGFVRKILIEIAAQTNAPVEVLTGKVTWTQLGLNPDTFRRLAMDLAIVAQQWATVIPPPVVTPDEIAKAKNLGLAVVFMIAAAFGQVITEDQAGELINMAKAQPRAQLTSEYRFALALAPC